MPSLFKIHGYSIYFWANENNEPIHVHVSKGVPSANSTKIWLTKDGGCIVANNESKIPQSELNQILRIISAQFFSICNEWKTFFATDKINFYC